MFKFLPFLLLILLNIFMAKNGRTRSSASFRLFRPFQSAQRLVPIARNISVHRQSNGRVGSTASHTLVALSSALPPENPIPEADEPLPTSNEQLADLFPLEQMDQVDGPEPNSEDGTKRPAVSISFAVARMLLMFHLVSAHSRMAPASRCLSR
jgi:hypothetical protein